LGSQALETAIGLVLMLFVFATAASAIVEIYASKVGKRSKDLKAAVKEMLATGDLPGGGVAVADADIERLLKRATGKASASYLSAKAFADAATELVAKGENIGYLQDRMAGLAREAHGKLTDVKAGLETWFDETMRAAEERYTKWASWFLFVTGLFLAVVLNASLLNVAQDLWRDAAARDAVVEAAGSVETVTATCEEGGTAVEQAQCSVDSISAFQLPLGWGEAQRDGLDGGAGEVIAWSVTHLVGWFLTAVLLMLGAAFWFDLLGRLVNLRATSKRPKEASDDDGSSSTLVRAAPTGGAPPTSSWVPDVATAAVRMGDRIAAAAPEAQQPALPPAENQRVDLLLGNAHPSDYAAPPVSDAQNVDWLATALNLGKPLAVVVEERRRAGSFPG